MTKIAIISQAEQGVLIDISGCSSLTEAKQYLTSTLQVSSQFWEGLIVDLNLGPLVLTPEQVNEIQAIVSEVGVQPRQIFSLSPITRSSLIQCRLPLGVLGQLQGYASMRPVEERVSPFTQAASAEAESGATGASTAGGAVAATAEYTEPYSEASWEADKHSTIAPQEPVQLPELLVNQVEPLHIPNQYYDNDFADDLPSRAGKLSMPNHHLTAPVQQAPAAKITPAVKPVSPKPAGPAVLMMKQTLRSGQRVSHKGHLVIIGDVNPGAELVADGDITVWGALRGMAHAGAGGNTNAEIRALKFEPIQLRIAHAIARSPDRNKSGANVPSGPETARVIDGKIRLSVSDPE